MEQGCGDGWAQALLMLGRAYSSGSGHRKGDEGGQANAQGCGK